ncbi:hypothetical protein [Accumulibacter sp.]|uniref:hypothetical protein n=1 Tax=Accumulibacter sp. TaxID=2053492 RepID=UPI0025C3B0CE|nr:hypothetical protein [Accumulibacter sp.]
MHGLWTPAAVFGLHGSWLRRRGHRALRFAYPSVRCTLSKMRWTWRASLAQPRRSTSI